MKSNEVRIDFKKGDKSEKMQVNFFITVVVLIHYTILNKKKRRAC